MSRFVYKRQAIDELVPGMVLGKMLVTSDGKNFLNEGAVLTLRVIQTLQLWGFRYVETREELFSSSAEELETHQEPLLDWNNAKKDVVAPTPDVILACATPSTAEKPQEISCEDDIPPDVSAGFLAYYQAAVQMVKQSLARARFQKNNFDVSDIRQMVRECVLPLLEDASVLDNLKLMPQREDYLYHHSVEVGVISGALGLWLGKSFHEIEEIIFGGLLHDVGKALIPLKVLNKPGALTEEEMNLVRFHPVRGYKFLRETTELPRNILLCVLQHHERMDGSGYPLAVHGDKIHPYAKVVAIADVFDAMTSSRSYGRKSTPYEAVEVLKHEMYGKMDAEACAVFFDRICKRSMGDIVQLSNGFRAEVVFLNVFDVTRPMVRTQDGEFIDLEKRRDLSICKLLHS